MMENHDVSIDDVRALVAERQRYDDWLEGLEARRDATPQRVFDRVQDDYQTRRDVVLAQLRDHVESLKTMRMDFVARLEALDEKLAMLEDERAEAMLRTAVGEFDDDRWEKVRTEVEAQIEDFGGQRTSLHEEITDVSELLSSADTPIMVVAIADENTDENADAAITREESAGDTVADSSDAAITVTLDELTDRDDHTDPSTTHTSAPNLDGMMMVSVEVNRASPLDISDDMLLDDVGSVARGVVSGKESGTTADDEDTADIDDALALFSNNDDADHDTSTDERSAPKLGALDGMKGFDASRDRSPADRGAASTATVTPQSSPTVSPATSGEKAGAADASSDGFDDLAFLRSVVDPTAPSSSTRAAGQSDQQKTLRCTECSTMNLPTEWYCERCGGELAAF